MKLPWLIVVLAAARAAHAGELDAELGVDFLYSSSRNPSPAAGEPAEFLHAEDLGLRLRADLLDLDDRLAFNLDYLGREPLGGTFPNATHRLLYRAELSYQILKDTLTLGVGRFIPASAVLLPVDGARLELELVEVLSLRAFGGRRAINTSRMNIELDRFLPAVGGGAALDLSWGRFDLSVAWAADDFLPLDYTAPAEKYEALNLLFFAVVEPVEGLRIGTREAFVDQANVFLGPAWTAHELELQVLHFFGAALFADYEPLRWLRFSVDGQIQSAAVVRAGTVDLAGVVTRDEEPTFYDAGLTVAVFPFELGWARPNFHARRRPDRTELRYGIGLDVLQLGLPGLRLAGFFTYEDVRFDGDVAEPPNLDRLLWSAALGYRGFDLDVEAGARYLDRFGPGPFTARAASGGVSSDLAPFVLEAQRVAFLRAFYVYDWFFVGADVEQSLTDRELRFFLQAGTFVEQSW